MSEKVSIIYNGDSPVNFRCPEVMKFDVRKGDLIEGVSRETYDNELKNDPRYSLVSEKPAQKEKLINKMQRPTESEGK